MSLSLLRIEFKLDLILHALKEQDPVLRELLRDGNAFARYGDDLCPVCNEPVSLTLDVKGEAIRRDCGCRPPFRVIEGISALASAPRPEPSKVLHMQPLEDVVEDPDPVPVSTTSSQKGAP